MEIQQIAVMGAGAVGCYFGGMLARAGMRVTLIARRETAEAVARDALFLDSIHFQERVAVAASTQPDAARDAELVLFCVKTRDTEEAARALAPHLKPGAIVASLQNGVDNVERIRAAAGIDALPSVVYVAASVPAPGRVKHVGRGDLIIGHPTRRAECEQVAASFARAGVPCRISDNIERELWTKLVWNCAGNAISALGRVTYGQLVASEEACRLLEATVLETVAVARAAGIALPGLEDPQAAIASALKLLQRDLGQATSSTLQDVLRGRRTEIDSLNGYVVRRGRELGVPTPVNYTLYALVKLLEENLQTVRPKAAS
jgi:2-dehydropantoate 2-reductase